MGKVRNFFREQSITLPLQKEKQMLALDQQFDTLESQVTTLQAQKLHLEAEVNPLKRENERLKQQLEKKGSPSLSLDKTKEEMLKVLNEHPHALTEDIARAFDLTNDGATFHLEVMRKMKFVDNYYGDEGENWGLLQEGRAYLHNKGWLK